MKDFDPNDRASQRSRAIRRVGPHTAPDFTRSFGSALALLFGAAAAAQGPSAPLQPPVPAAGYAPAITLPLNGAISALSICSADFNQDGFADLALGTWSGGPWVILGHGTGSFGSPIPLPVSLPQGCFVRAADPNDDAFPDLLVMAPSGVLKTYLGHGDGSFADPQESQLPPFAQEFALADVNQDRKPDLLRPDPESPWIQTAIGAGDGTFVPSPGSGQSTPLRSVVSADFNRDGFPDVAVSRYYEGTIAIALGRGQGMPFEIAASIPTMRPGGMTTADLNLDGFDDLVVVHGHEDTVSVLLSRGDGQFGPPVAWGVGNLPVAVAAGDLNSDGRPDLAVANWQSANLSVLLGRGDGTFEPTQDHPVDREPTALVMADFNRDGRLDLATCSKTLATVSVLLSDPSRSVAAPARPPTPHIDFVRENGPRHEYVIRSWNTSDGLPQSTVLCMLRTRDGYLWVGTQRGLARFDGHEFRVFDETSEPPLTTSHCRSLAEDTQGTLWIGSAEGLSRLKAGRFEKVIPLNDPGLGHVRSILPHPGGLWYLDGPQRRDWVDGALRDVDTLHVHDPHTLMLGRDGSIWGQSTECLWRQRPGLDSPDYLSWSRAWDPHETGGRGLLEDRSGRIWLTRLGGIHIWDRGHVQILTPEQGGWAWDADSVLAEDPTGQIWVGNEKSGLFRLREGRITAYTTRDGLSDNAIRCLLADADGNVWVGTERGGLNRLQRRRVVQYTTEDGLVGDDVWSIAEDTDGSVLLATSSGASRFSGGTFTSFQLPAEVDPTFPLRARVRNIAADSQGTIWAQVSTGLAQVRGNELAPLRPLPHPLLRDISGIFPDTHGTTWFTAIHLLAAHFQGQWTFRNVGTTPTSYPHLLGFLSVSSEEHWVGSHGSGVYHLVGTHQTQLTQADGFTSNLIAPILADTNGVVWFASDRGLNRWEKGRITRYTTDHGLPENIVLNVLDDRLGHFWLNGHRGIHRIPIQALEEVAANRTSRVEAITFDAADGLLSAEGNGGVFPNSCRTRDGKLWFPTTHGAVVIDPAAIADGDRPAQVHIQRVKVDGRTVRNELQADVSGPAKPSRPGEPVAGKVLPKAKDPIRLKPGTGRLLEIEFADILSAVAGRVEFRYRLQGAEHAWRDAGKERRAVYSSLPPGTYHFQLMARSPLGTWRVAQETLDLHLEPFFHQTRWFLVLGAVAGLLLILAVQGYRLAVQRRFLRLQHEAQWAREQERISRDLHDDLGASLSRIAILGQVAQRQITAGADPSKHVEEISEIASTVIDDMGELIWASNPRYDTWESLVAYLREFASRSFADTPIACHQQYPETLPASPVRGELRRQLFLAFKEVLTNIHKHAQASRVEVLLDVTPHRLTLQITDDGRGFDPSNVPPLHHGLSNLRHRVQQLHGTLEIRSQTQQGTRILLDIPIVTEPNRRRTEKPHAPPHPHGPVLPHSPT